jgi:hypothetical protein
MHVHQNHNLNFKSSYSVEGLSVETVARAREGSTRLLHLRSFRIICSFEGYKVYMWEGEGEGECVVVISK